MKSHGEARLTTCGGRHSGKGGEEEEEEVELNSPSTRILFSSLLTFVQGVKLGIMRTEQSIYRNI